MAKRRKKSIRRIVNNTVDAVRDGAPPTSTFVSARTLNRKELGEHVAKLISSERNDTHGDPHDQFRCAQALKVVMATFRQQTNNRSQIGVSERESLDMMLTKISRIICGSNLQDHWLDLAGYALIAAEKAEKPL